MELFVDCRNITAISVGSRMVYPILYPVYKCFTSTKKQGMYFRVKLSLFLLLEGNKLLHRGFLFKKVLLSSKILLGLVQRSLVLTFETLLNRPFDTVKLPLFQY
jgi:hypothetical protein